MKQPSLAALQAEALALQEEALTLLKAGNTLWLEVTLRRDTANARAAWADATRAAPLTVAAREREKQNG